MVLKSLGHLHLEKKKKNHMLVCGKKGKRKNGASAFFQLTQGKEKKRVHLPFAASTGPSVLLVFEEKRGRGESSYRRGERREGSRGTSALPDSREFGKKTPRKRRDQSTVPFRKGGGRKNGEP